MIVPCNLLESWSGAMTVTWIDMLGYLASASVLTTFCMRRMVPLRVMALVSNLLFLGFGALAHVYPVMILHLILLPVNAASLLQLHWTAHDTASGPRCRASRSSPATGPTRRRPRISTP
jgi:hypothetical protein